MLPLLFSCEREGTTAPDDSRQSVRLLRFGVPTIGGTSATRAPVSGNVFGKATWEFGMFIYNSHEGNDAHQPVAVGHDDIKAIAMIPSSSEGKSADWTFWFNPVGEGGSVREFTNLGVPKDEDGIVVAYYPYPQDGDDIRAPHSIRFDTSDATDYLWATPKEYSQTSIDEEIVLNFHHVMTCIEIQVKNMYYGNITLNSITLTDTDAQEDGAGSCIGSAGHFDAYDGTIDISEYTRSITYTDQIIRNSLSSFCFIIPPIEAGKVRDGRLQISLTLNGMEIPPYNLPLLVDGQNLQETGYRRGCRYQYKITVDNTMKFQPGDVSNNDPDHWYPHEKEINIPI